MRINTFCIEETAGRFVAQVAQFFAPRASTDKKHRDTMSGSRTFVRRFNERPMMAGQTESGDACDGAREGDRRQ
jgi:hypothetical protein